MHQHHLTPSDWDALASDPEFRELMAGRRRFVLPATVFFALFYLALPICIALAPAAMSAPVIGPLTRAWAFALAQFVTSWLLLALYMRAASRWDEHAARIAERAHTEFSA